MRILPSSRAPRSGLSLLECIVYLAVCVLVLGLAFGAYFQMGDQTRNLTRNSADIVRAVQAGEQWRADVRLATNVLAMAGEREWRLLTPRGEIAYSFRENTVWRKGLGEKSSLPMLANAKASTMSAEARTHVRAWRWEVELQSKRTNATIRPLFTFVAVPTGGVR